MLSEVAKYFHKRAPFDAEVFEDQQLTSDPALFWELFRSAAPCLAALASRLLAISIDGGSLDEVFSTVDRTYDCNRLHPDKLSALMRVKSHLTKDNARALDTKSVPDASVWTNMAGMPSTAEAITWWEIGDDDTCAALIRTREDWQQCRQQWLDVLADEWGPEDSQLGQAKPVPVHGCSLANLFSSSVTSSLSVPLEETAMSRMGSIFATPPSF